MENENLKGSKGINDSVLQSLLIKYCARAHEGYGKYRKTLDRTDLEFFHWCQHLQEELMDASLYLEKILKDFEGKEEILGTKDQNV